MLPLILHDFSLLNASQSLCDMTHRIQHKRLWEYNSFLNQALLCTCRRLLLMKADISLSVFSFETLPLPRCSACPAMMGCHALYQTSLFVLCSTR